MGLGRDPAVAERLGMRLYASISMWRMGRHVVAALFYLAKGTG
jgi:hypothetical protein